MSHRSDKKVYDSDTILDRTYMWEIIRIINISIKDLIVRVMNEEISGEASWLRKNVLKYKII